MIKLAVEIVVVAFSVLAGGGAQTAREPVFLSHRGLARHAPENTLPAFAASLELGLSFELDVYQTKDGHLVVIHDQTVDRTTNGKGDVAKMTLAEVRKLDAGRWFHPSFARQPVPTLEEVFKLVRQRQRGPVMIALHMKMATPEIEEQVVQLVRRYELFDQLFAFGMSAESGRRLKQTDRRIKVASYVVKTEDFDKAMSASWADDIWVTFAPASEQVERAHAAGKRIWMWDRLLRPDTGLWKLCDTARAIGVDGICTDYPLECRRRWMDDRNEKK